MGGDHVIPLGSFLWERIRQLSVGALFGLPGDMNLALLDYVKEVEGLHWVGNANELNAAYAADGYSRIKGCPGVILTTCGVGELSALNGIAGAYSESVKIIHVVGVTPTEAKKKRLMIHHSLGEDPDHEVYAKMSSHVRVAGCWLDDEATAASEIDRVIRECYVQSRPVYIHIPLDMVHRPVAASKLKKKLDLKPTSDQAMEKSAVEAVVKAIYCAKNPVLLVDALIARYGAKDIVQNLAETFQFWTFCPPMGKSIIDETKSYFHGLYAGKISFPGIQDAIENQGDLVIHLGPLLSDGNTGRFSAHISDEKLIAVKANSVTVKGEEFPGVHIKSFLTALHESIDVSKLPRPAKLSLPPPPTPPDSSSSLITQSWIWERIGRFLRPNDILFSDSGTPQFGFPDVEFPAINYIMQGYFASLGYALPAMFGGAMAKREMKNEDDGRVILVVGDGALQLTVQEISTMIKEKLDVIIIIINNNGYTIERALLNPKEEYHEIQPWDYKHMLSFFGDQTGASNTYQVHTKVEFNSAIELPAFTEPRGVQILEIVMDKMDFPWRIRETARARNLGPSEVSKIKETQSH